MKFIFGIEKFLVSHITEITKTKKSALHHLLDFWGYGIAQKSFITLNIY